MCGIAGYRGTREIPPARIDECLALMHRRGPDHAGAAQWISDEGTRVHLLGTRLSIVDLDPRAAQPFRVGSKCIVYNGELYNYVERGERLKADGVALETTSDTEVLLRSIDRYGWDALDGCEGMWAFAVYDQADGSLTLSRDRFGEKPLFVFRDASGMYFGSEVKFIVSLLGRHLLPNLDHLRRFLVNGYKALYKDGHTFFEGLTELPPASLLRLDRSGEETTHRYWTPRICPEARMSYDEAVEGAREHLIRAVKLRLRADVPMAFCLSGGVDSNGLVSIAKKVFGYDVHGFTIVNSDERYEEQEMVGRAVAELGLRHTEVPLTTEDFLPKLRTLVRQHDAPVYTITYYVHWLLMESVAAHGYRISVSGTAADELFSGYYDHHLGYLFEILDDRERHAAARRAWEEHIKPIVRNPFLQDPDAFVKNPGQRDHIFLNADEFADFLQPRWQEPFTEKTFTDRLLRNRMLNELFHENVPVILHEDDLNAMYFSIENRSPYLDRDLFEFANRIPTRHLIQDGRAKSVLRDAMRGIMPEPLRVNRRKVGFNAPIFSLLDVDNPGVRASLLDDGSIFDHVKRDKIEALVGKRDLPNSESKFLFNFLNCKIFLEEFAA